MDSIKYRDLDLDFTRHPVTHDVVVKINADAVKRSVRNLILLNLYDKPFHPEISTNLSGMLFENIDAQAIYEIRNKIGSILAKYEPRVKLIVSRVTPDFDNNRIDAHIEFYIVNIPGTFTLQIPIVRTR